MKKSILYCNLQYNRALGHVMLHSKIIKNWTQDRLNNHLKINAQIATIFHPSLYKKAPIWGANLRPSWHEIALKIHPTTNQKKHQILHRFLIEFLMILAPKLASKSGPREVIFNFY